MSVLVAEIFEPGKALAIFDPPPLLQSKKSMLKAEFMEKEILLLHCLAVLQLSIN